MGFSGPVSWKELSSFLADGALGEGGKGLVWNGEDHANQFGKDSNEDRSWAGTRKGVDGKDEEKDPQNG